jgi:hypothetical protein
LENYLNGKILNGKLASIEKEIKLEKKLYEQFACVEKLFSLKN